MAQDLLASGFVKLCIDPSLNFYDGKCRVLVEGQYVPNPLLATPVIPDIPVQITSTRYIDQMFTAGSVLAESLKAVFCSCPDYIEVYALPREDAAGAVAATYEITITGPATSDGTFTLFLGNKDYSVSAIVTAGDTAAVIAAAVAAEIPANFPYTVTDLGTGVLQLVAKNAGTVGNFLNPIYNWAGWQNYAPTGVTVSTVRTVAGSGNPVAIDYASALGTCCYCCFALLTDDRTWQRGMRDYIRSLWSCDTPQCFGHGFTYNSGTLGQVLAAGDNSAEFNRLAVPVNDVNFPWLMVANQMAKRCCSVVDNPEKSIQGRVDGVLECIYRPENCATPWSHDEMEQLKDAGFNVYLPLQGGQGQLTSPYVANDVTNYLYDELNRPNTTFRDTNSRYLTAKTALEVADIMNQNAGLALFTRNTKIKDGTFGTNLRMLTAELHDWARSKVGELFSEFDNLEKDVTVKEDFEVAPKCQGKPCVIHANIRYRPPCRLNRINVNMQPFMLQNCVR